MVILAKNCHLGNFIYLTFTCGSAVFDAITTFAPSDAALSAIAFPIPLDAPVMKRVLPVNLL